MYGFLPAVSLKIYLHISYAKYCRSKMQGFKIWILDIMQYYVAVKDPIECVILTDTKEGKKKTFKLLLLLRDRINVTMHKNSINYQLPFFNVSDWIYFTKLSRFIL